MDEKNLSEQIDAMLGDENAMFSDEEVHEFYDQLHSEGVVDWTCIDNGVEDLFTAPVENNEEINFIFHITEREDELSKEDLIDLVLNIERKYQETKGKVVYNG